MNMIRAGWGPLVLVRSGELHSPRATEDTAHPRGNPGRDRCRVCVCVCVSGSREEGGRRADGVGVSKNPSSAQAGLRIRASAAMSQTRWAAMVSCRRSRGAAPIVATPVRALGPGDITLALGQNCARKARAKCWGVFFCRGGSGSGSTSGGEQSSWLTASGCSAISCKEKKVGERRWRLCSHSRIASQDGSDARHAKAAICCLAPNARPY